VQEQVGDLQPDGNRAGDRCVAAVRADRGLRAADAPGPSQRCGQWQDPTGKARAADLTPGGSRRRRARYAASFFRAGLACCGPGGQAGAQRDLRQQAWQCALANRAGDGSLPSGREIARQYGRHERWPPPGQALRCRGRVQCNSARDFLWAHAFAAGGSARGARPTVRIMTGKVRCWQAWSVQSARGRSIGWGECTQNQCALTGDFAVESRS
jgi:hypothetical protein